MRIVHLLFLVSVALFISGIGFVIAAARTSRDVAPEAAVPTPVAVASISQVMAGITNPAAQAVYRSVGTVINAEGVKETEPQNDEEWVALTSAGYYNLSHEFRANQPVKNKMFQ